MEEFIELIEESLEDSIILWKHRRADHRYNKDCKYTLVECMDRIYNYTHVLNMIRNTMEDK